LLDAGHPGYLAAAHPGSLAATHSPAAVSSISVWRLAGRYIRTGIEHILSGPDHVLFVIGLLLLGQSLRAVLTTITAFTLAHSITLTIAALGLFAPSSRIIEPLIALSIVAIALENGLRVRQQARQAQQGRDYRPLVAFVFGLVHGFGFAGALADAGLGGRALWMALASFNVGVEMGQGAIVLFTVPLLAWCARRYAAQWRWVVVAGSLTIGVLGAHWFMVRL